MTHPARAPQAAAKPRVHWSLDGNRLCFPALVRVILTRLAPNLLWVVPVGGLGTTGKK